METVMLLVTIICWYVKTFNINKHMGRRGVAYHFQRTWFAYSSYVCARWYACMWVRVCVCLFMCNGGR